MGWLFAVARGLQERRRGAVLASLVPIVIGHEASVVVVAGAAVATQHLLAPPTVRLLAALVLSDVIGARSGPHGGPRPARVAGGRRAVCRQPVGGARGGSHQRARGRH